MPFRTKSHSLGFGLPEFPSVLQRGWSVAQRVMVNAGWSLLANLASNGSMLVALMFIVRVLGTDDTGRLSIVYATAIAFGAALGAPLGSTATKFLAEYLAHDPQRAGRVLSLCHLIALALAACGAGIGWFAAASVTSTALSQTQAACLASAAAIFLAANVTIQLQRGVLAGFQAFRVTGCLAVVNGLLSSALLVGGGLWQGLPGAAMGLAIGGVTLALLQRVAIHRELQAHSLKFDFHESLGEWRSLVAFGLPMLVSQNVVAAVNWGCLMALLKHPQGMLEVGTYTIANQWFTALQLVPAAVNTAMLPMMSHVFAQRRRQSAKKLLLLGIGLNGIAVVPVSIVLCCLAQPLMNSYGAEYQSGSLTFAICIVTSGLLALEVPIGTSLASQGRAWASLFMNLGWCIALAGTFAMMFQNGATGLASARFIAYVLHGIWTFAAAWIYLSHSTSGADCDASEQLQRSV